MHLLERRAEGHIQVDALALHGILSTVGAAEVSPARKALGALICAPQAPYVRHNLFFDSTASLPAAIASNRATI